MMTWLGIENKVIIVTGGSSGIGQAIVEELLANGAKVANFDLTKQTDENECLLFIKTDISSRSEVENAVQEVVEHWGTVDGLVNNAGINIPCLLVDQQQPYSKYELSDDIFERLVAVNQKGLYLVSQAVSRILVKKQSGAIVNMASEAGLEGSEGQGIYAATKAAAYSFTRSWAKELGRHGIRVVGVAPGIMEATGLRTLAYEEALAYTRGKTVEAIREGYSSVDTIPLGRSGKLKEVADLVLYYLSDRSSYISGITTNVSGGKTRG
ncbi:SDR family oxidoreductase [Streptococcus sp. H31]|uniref:SDR family oxidoreductase n=1 Tax=Streptococcus huangxiaojuni TaxID=3237239 RepID=UPI0034A195EA